MRSAHASNHWSAGSRLAGVAVGVLALVGSSACGQVDVNSGATANETTAASSATPSGATTRPGEDLNVRFPKGTELAVVGVAHDDALMVRRDPSADAAVIATLPPAGEGAVATGRGWLVNEMAWVEISTDQGTGWADLGSLAPRAGTDDLTADVVRRLGGRPTAPDMAALGRVVADALASTEPPSSIVMSVAPTTGDLGEVSYDVVGLGDDSISAQRLHIFGQQVGADGEFALRSVEATSFCARGSSTGGLCP